MISLYTQEVKPKVPSLEFPGWGHLSREVNTWYDFRIDPKGATEALGSLVYSPPDSAYLTYFGRKEQLTDENGVSDTAKAHLYLIGDDLETHDSIRSGILSY